MIQKEITILVFHAEQLHVEPIWKRVKVIAKWMRKRGCKATFFVFPFRARVDKCKIDKEVKYLHSIGHEIAQHTHFYKGLNISKPNKENDLSPENISKCLERDNSELREMGIVPKGFVAGGWLSNRHVLQILIELGIRYESSSRHPKPRHASNVDWHEWRTIPDVYRTEDGEILQLPTTCSLGEWYRWGKRRGVAGDLKYQLIYLHDYDLLNLKHYFGLWFFLLTNSERLTWTANEYSCTVLEGMGI